ncbi:MAG: hypothetical protein HYY59_05415, partial [Candidatus Omnitrophica bacterium]|nr:hypothetical protein [Candidatus Omnitrophota bacterium]
MAERLRPAHSRTGGANTHGRPHRRINSLWLLFGTLSLLAWWQIRSLGDVRSSLAAFYGWFALAFGVYLAAIWLVRLTAHPHPSALLPIGTVALVAVLARLFALGMTPTLSNDLYRYRWDGRVQLAGIDPYAYPPNDPAL